MVLRRVKQKQISFGYCDTKTGQRIYPPPPPTSEMTDLLPEQEPPSQASPLILDGSTGDPSSRLRLACHPPLAQSSNIPRSSKSVTFQVLIQASQPCETIEVRLWHNHNGEHDWSELAFKANATGIDNILQINGSDDAIDGRHQVWLTANLTGLPKHCHVVKFTIKYRLTPDQQWQWAKDTTGMPDGELHFFSPHLDISKHGAHELSQFFSNTSSDIAIQSERPDTDDTLLYSLTCPVGGAKGEDSAYQHHQLGKPVQTSKWFSLVRLWSPWLAPRQGDYHFELDRDGVLLSFLRSDGYHVVCLAISGVEEMVTTFISEDGNIVIKGRNDLESSSTARVLVAVAEEFEVANAAVMYHARKVVRDFAAPSTDAETKTLIDDNVKPEWIEEWYDGFTYCTWNGLGQNLTANKIYDTLDELKRNDINITNLIIDDNWQSLTDGSSQFKRGWSRFEANEQGFPDGMKATTKNIRDRHPNVHHIAVWHAILGYWGGIDPNSELAKEYKVIEVEKEPGVAGGKFHVVAAEDAKRMYDDFYRFLMSSGVDSVKTDAQFFLDMLLHAPDRRAMIKEYQDAWTLAHLRHFSSRAISCMSQSPQILFYEQLPTNKPRLLVRNSDDFFPDQPKSHPWHIFCNAHNSVLTQHLNVLPDWDMFQTSHPWSGFHAAGRCVSGGPIYFTDEPGKHNIELIRAMTASTVRGVTIILRPHTIGKALNVYNSYDAQAIVKVGTYVGYAKTGTSILGCFNVTASPICELIHLDTFPGTEQGDYIIGSFTSGAFSSPLRRDQDAAMVSLELHEKGWEILSAFPLRSLTVAGKAVQTSVLGLLHKMTGIAAVTGSDMYVESNGNLRIWVSLKALGVLGIYFSDLEQREIEDFIVVIYGNPIPKECVTKNEKSDKVLEIDVEEAWKRSGENPGWSNEVSLEIVSHG